jgi:hypothetical protein
VLRCNSEFRNFQQLTAVVQKLRVFAPRRFQLLSAFCLAFETEAEPKRVENKGTSAFQQHAVV